MRVCAALKCFNSIESYLHHYLDQYSLLEKHVELHCDNCSGQNENRYMLWYSCKRVACVYHTSVALHFMLSGHTKFALDGNGLVKHRFNVCAVNFRADIQEVVTSSRKSNIVQLVG